MAFHEYFLSLATDKKRGITASVVTFLLYLLSLPYGCIIRLLSFLQSRKPFISQGKVISVGNITLGGTGKTVLVEYLVSFFLKEGRKVCVLSRGYKLPAVPGCGASLYEQLGDEAGMLKNNFPEVPVLVDPDRVRSLRTAASQGIEITVLDDGFQQWRIRKDLDIVCVDAAGFGNACVIPRGILREPLSALKRAGVFVITNTRLVAGNQVQQLTYRLAQMNPSALIAESTHEPAGLYTVPKNEQRDPRQMHRVCYVCGIGNPASFFDCCRRAGIVDGARLTFADHHRFTRADIQRIASRCKKDGISAVVTTEKDAMRIPIAWIKECGLELYVLKVAIRFTRNEHEFTARLRSLCAA